MQIFLGTASSEVLQRTASGCGLKTTQKLYLNDHASRNLISAVAIFIVLPLSLLPDPCLQQCLCKGLSLRVLGVFFYFKIVPSVLSKLASMSLATRAT